MSLWPDVGWSARRACEIAGISYRQLDYWCRTDRFAPSLSGANGSGSNRRFSLRDVQALILMARMNEHGVPLDRASRVALRWRDGGHPADSGFVLLFRRHGAFVSTGDEFVAAVRESSEPLITVLVLASALSTSALRAAIGGTASAGVDSGAAGPSVVGRGGPPPRVRPTAAGHPPAPGGSHPETHDPRGRVLADSHEGR